MESAATFSAKIDYDKLETLQLRIQASAIDAKTWEKYRLTLSKFTTWATVHHYELNSEAALHWCTYLATVDKLLPTTIDQYLSHLQFFAKMGLLPPMRQPKHRLFIKGLTKVVNHTIPLRLLLPSTIVRLFHATPRTLILDAMLFQWAVGLRGGHLLHITPEHILQNSFLHVPPYKHCTSSNLLPMAQVPKVILSRFLSYAKDPQIPIVPWNKPMYHNTFKRAMASLGLHQTSHSLRHAFATIQQLLNSPIQLIGAYMIHANPTKTTPTYLHSLPPCEVQCIINHPDLFIPLQPAKLDSASFSTQQCLLE